MIKQVLLSSETAKKKLVTLNYELVIGCGLTTFINVSCESNENCR